MAILHNPIVETILARRSIRAFDPDHQLNDDQLETLFACGFSAPSGMNCQSWHMTVVQDAALLGDINKGFVKMIKALPVIPPIMVERLKNPNYSVFYHAPTVILVCYETAKGPTNSALLAENIVLAAQSLGLGTCYIGGVLDYLCAPDGKPYLQRLKIPDGCAPAFFLSVGKPLESPDARPRDTNKIAWIR
jgi:nitroreductase